MKRLGISLLVLLVLLVAADRVAAQVAARAVAAQAQAAAELSAEPEVTLGGFPFLTQALSGRYDRVEVRAEGVTTPDLTLRRLDATLSGVRVPLSAALSGSVDSAPVERIAARALVGFDELSRRSGDRRLVVSAAGEQVRVSGSVDVLGRTVSAAAVSRVEVVEGDVVVTAESIEVDGSPADDLLARALRGLLDLRIPITGLPYGLQVSGVEVTADGVVVLATARATVLVAP